MSAGKRGEVVPRPAGWVARFASKSAAEGWEELRRQAASNLDTCWITIITEPRQHTSRHHPLKGERSTRQVSGVLCDAWQYEVTSAGRVWYAIDDAAKILWIFHAGPGHPKATE